LEDAKTGVGVIGDSSLHSGWAISAHIPALTALPNYEWRAVCTSRRASAQAASQALVLWPSITKS
jgi:predicted dehydrogenase